MQKRIICTLLVTGLLILSSGSALASGFSIYEAGSKATALGCAFTATADDGSALFYNAAGLSFMTGSRAEVNAVFVAPQFKFSGKLNKSDPTTSTGEAESKVYPVPGAYYTNNNNNKLAFGVGVYAPFGLGVVWQDGAEWVGRRISHDVQIQTVYVTPAISLKLSDSFALAAGVDIAQQELELKKYTPEPATGENAIHSTIKGSSSINLTPSLGLMFRPNEKLSIGAMYHFKKTMKFDDADATLDPVAPGDDPWGNTLVGGLGGSEQKLTSDLNLPDIMSLGIAYTFGEKFKAEFNYVRFGWSTFDKLALNFENDALDQTIHFNYEDSWQLRFGFDYQASEKLNLMAGYVYDKTPQPLVAVSPLLPDSDRNDYSIGALYKAGKWDFNVSYMLVVGDERTNIEDGEPVRNTTDYPFGTYSSLANLFGVGVGYNF
ncbi:MAG: porin [Candidatus Krumholzibacteria bacterium]|nr:porin [Candidatus Krumholzibacteria bacterium]